MGWRLWRHFSAYFRQPTQECLQLPFTEHCSRCWRWILHIGSLFPGIHDEICDISIPWESRLSIHSHGVLRAAYVAPETKIERTIIRRIEIGVGYISLEGFWCIMVRPSHANRVARKVVNDLMHAIRVHLSSNDKHYLMVIINVYRSWIHRPGLVNMSDTNVM